MAFRRTVLLRLTPDERGPHPHLFGRQVVPPPGTMSTFGKTRRTSAIPSHLDNTSDFLLLHDRERARHFLEHRFSYYFTTRKVPEFWKNYQFYYRVGEAHVEYREAKLRCRIQELFMNDACQCTRTEAFELVRVADRLVTLIKDGSKDSLRIVQEFFDVKAWDGGRLPRNWSGVGERGDMRAMYKALDDYPQRFKNRNGNYAIVTHTHTPFLMKGDLVDPDANRTISLRAGTISIVEMSNRDLSLFHRGQLITGDKGDDVWDHEKDRPLLDTHRGFVTQPPYAQEDAEIKDVEEREARARGGQEDYVRNPEYIMDTEKSSDDNSVMDYTKHSLNRTWGMRYSRGRNKQSQEELEEWPVDLENIEDYIKNMRAAATDRKMYLNENFYKLFPTVKSKAWIEKVYKPFMRMSDDRQLEVYRLLENTNIHNLSDVLLTTGLPIPAKVEEEAFEEIRAKTWKMKMEFMKHFPYTDPRDREFMAQSAKDGFDGKIREELDREEERSST